MTYMFEHPFKQSMGPARYFLPHRYPAECWWLMPVITTWEAEIRRILFQGQLRAGV
jgi:hypothetical protein